MAMAPLPASSVARLIESHQQLSRDWAELEGLLVELAPAWAEVRKLLNEINRVLGSADRATGGPLAD